VFAVSFPRSRFILLRGRSRSGYAPVAVLIFIKFDIRSFCARITSMDAIRSCTSIRNEELSLARDAGEPQPDCKAIVPFRKSNPFLAVTIGDGPLILIDQN